MARKKAPHKTVSGILRTIKGASVAKAKGRKSQVAGVPFGRAPTGHWRVLSRRVKNLTSKRIVLC